MEYASLATDPRTLVLGYGGRIEQFTRSPLHPRARASAMRWIFSSLLRFDEEIGLRGDLAERWEQSPDGLRYTFWLRRDAVWHDGEPVTADDVVYSASLLQQPTRYFMNTLHLSTGEPAVFEALDAYTVQVTTPRPYAALPAYLTATWASLFLIVPRHVVEAVGEAAFEEHPIGSGPFRFGEITGDGNAVLLANERYFGGVPQVDRVVLRLFANNPERRAAFERGELDVVVTPGRQFTAEAAEQHDGRLFSIPSNQIVHFGLNSRNPLFASARVRQAIACAVDRSKLVREIEGPDGLPAYGPVGPTCWAYEPNVEQHPYNPARALQLLAEEGWLPGPDGQLRRDGEPFRFEVIFVPDAWNVDYAAYATGIKSALAVIGIELTVRPVEYWNGVKPVWRSQVFDAFMYYDTFYNEPDLYWSWHSSMPRRPDGPDTDAPASLPQYGYGVTGYANPQVDDLVVAARETVDRDTRKALLSEAQRILADEVASLWLFNFPYRTVAHNRVRGLSKPSLAEGTADLIVTLHPEHLNKVTG